MKKVFVANRSEIACRIFQTSKELGFKAVGVVAPGDEQARHLTFADEIYEVKSYLDIASVVSAAQKAKADFIHPGYGFLSERPAFVRAVEAAGIQFMGPRAETMEALGDKIGAKELAQKTKVPTLSWKKVSPGESLKDAAKSVGFPLLLKASAGGGGKGMRRVNRPEELDAAAESASAEAQSSFGDGTLFLEKLVEKPRHIEVQILGDGKGGGIHLYERECSLQRRHQKVWEEATAPNLSEKTRNGLFEAALKLVKEVKYRSAGTMEFLVDEAGGFYFLEMNARLQVEHPVTELVTGMDLVAEQLKLTDSSHKLPETPFARGSAIEVRIYAEDPAMGYAPTPGTVEKLRWPMGPGIRVDSGIEEGQTIGTSFDSMLAKLIVFAPTRAHAVARLRLALSDTVILGMGTNQSFLKKLTEHPEIMKGHMHTGLLGQDFENFAPPLTPSDFSLLAQIKELGTLGGEQISDTSSAAKQDGKNPFETRFWGNP